MALFYCTKNRLYHAETDFRFNGPISMDELLQLVLLSKNDDLNDANKVNACVMLQENDVISNAGQMFVIRNGSLHVCSESALPPIEAPQRYRSFYITLAKPGVYVVEMVDYFTRPIRSFAFHCEEMISLPILLHGIDCGMNVYLNDFVNLYIGDDMESYRMTLTGLVKLPNVDD